ncbi:MAG: histidine kinase dimerization/phospho-acceptor domain-containing protein [Cyanobacteria bacterium J06621_8]
MSSDFTYLSDFVDPVPICQSGVDLGSIIKIFQHLNCDLLAIPQDNGHWGIIYPEDLIGFLATAWQGKTTALISHPRNIAAQQEQLPIATPQLKSIIKPAAVLAAEMKLQEFLQQVYSEDQWSEQSDRLIITRTGELKGKLNRGKIIQFLVQKSPKLSPNKSELANDFSYLSQVVARIALPIRIETATGQEIYRNRLWQQFIDSDYDTAIPSCQSNPPQFASGRLTQQQLPLTNSLPPESPSCQSNNDSRTQNNEPPTESNIFSSESQEQNYLSPDQPIKLTSPSKSSSPAAASSDWNFFKIPLMGEQLVDSAPEQQSAPCLVIATKVALPEFEESSEKYFLKAPYEITNNLLASISHELKSPLTGIIGLSSLLNEQKLGQLNQRQAAYVQLMHRSGQKMMDIIDDLLELTRLTIKPEAPELVNLELLCRQVYQEAIAKVRGASRENLESLAIAAELSLDIEFGSEMAIASSALLSCILSHLILEVIPEGESQPTVGIKISNQSGLTAIAIASSSEDLDLQLPSINQESPLCRKQSFGLDLMLAEYLAGFLEGSIAYVEAQEKVRFTLFLPKNHQPPQPASTPHPTAIAQSAPENKNLTILCLYPELEAINPTSKNSNSYDFNLKSWSDNTEQQSNYQHRIIEADSLEQAHILARIWRFDVIVLDSYQLIEPITYLRSLLESEYLAALPLITLEARTTEAANKIEGLNVYPCLLPAQDCRVQDLMQVIEIAAGK